MFLSGKPLSKSMYLVGVVVIFFAVYLPYFVPLGQIEGYLVVYGAPVLVVSVLFGRQILGRAAKNNVEAVKLSLGSFGGFYVVGIFLSMVVLAFLLQFDSSVEQLLQKPNPALDVEPNVAWAMMGVSMLVIGPAEEYLFRGFMYGGLLSLSKGKHWVLLAFASGLMFAFAHGYYAVAYGVASPIFFIQLTAFGVAMAVAYYWSGGNLIAIAAVHGINDVIGFLGVATNRSTALAVQAVLVAVRVAFAIFYVLLKKVRMNPHGKEEVPSGQPSLSSV